MIGADVFFLRPPPGGDSASTLAVWTGSDQAGEEEAAIAHRAGEWIDSSPGEHAWA